MKVSVIVGAESAYACITGEGFSLDVKLAHGKSPAQSLMESATDEMMKAQAMIERAGRMKDAALVLIEQGR